MAAEKATGATFEAYARERALRPEPPESLPAAVPLLTLESSGVGDVIGGKLPGGIEGSVAHYTWTRKQGDSTVRHPFTVALTAVPESIAFMPRLLLRDRSQPTSNHGTFEDFATAPLHVVRLESEALDDRYRLYVPTNQDEGWVRQLFQPTFQDWLVTDAPAEFAFELYDGALCGYVTGHLESSADLDALCRATARVAERLREESLEQEGGAGTAPTTRDPIVDGFLDEVEWPDPPADAATAVRAYRPVMRRARGSYKAPLGAGATSAAVSVFYFEFEPAGFVLAPLIGLGVGAVTLNKVVRDRAVRLGEEAFLRGYAQSRGLRHEDPRTFQARHMRLALPGVAVGVASGRLPGFGQGSLVMCSNRRDRRRKLGFRAVVSELATVPPARIMRPPAPDAPGIAAHGRTVCVYEPAPGWTRENHAGLDEFCARAAEALREAGGDRA